MNKLSTLLLTALLVFYNTQLLGQIYDFEDGIIPNLWNGNRADFKVSNANQLQLNAPAGSTVSSVWWPCVPIQNCTWEFYVNYAFAASTTNYAVFYLLSTESDFSAANNISYYLKIGGVAGSSDKIELIFQQGSTKQVVLESRTGIVGGSQVNCRIQVTKNAMGVWELKADTAGAFNYIKEASGQHWVSDAFKYSGIRCIYSSTRRDKFYFDDIKIREPFIIQNYTFENDSILKIYFNQTLSTSAEPLINTGFNIPYIIIYERDYVLLSFQRQVPPGIYTGSFNNIFSNNGDPLSNTILEIIKEQTYYVGQIRISEWMSDPSPSYGLPEVEWIELVNMSNEPIDLSKISISDPSSKIKLPTYLLKSDSVVIVSSFNTCQYFTNQNCIEVNALPSLNNTSDSIFIWAKDSLLIDFVWYNTSTMPSDFRRDGGYSMVRKEYPQDCFFSQKIDFAQEHLGGSPGTIDRLYKTSTLTTKTTIVTEHAVNIKMDLICGIISTDFFNVLNVKQVDNNQYLYGTAYTFYLNEALEAGNMYNFTIDSIRTCRNQIQGINEQMQIIYPKQLEKNEMFVNEVLYNPNPGGVDFIEVYNTSSKYIQLQQSHFYNESNGVVQHLYIADNYIVEPMGYATLTSDSAILKSQYANTVSANTFQIAHFLSLPDAGGKVTWINQKNDTLDQISYGDTYQNPLHRDTEGYSLEKISSSETYFYSANWTTAAVHATPGYVNSQKTQLDNSAQKSFYCSPCHVTTNLNGINDYAMLHLTKDTQGCFGSIGIYRLSGEKIIDLVVNQSLGNMNTFQWNGQQQSGAILEDGIYIAVAEWWSPEGKTFTSKIAISTSQY